MERDPPLEAMPLDHPRRAEVEASFNLGDFQQAHYSPKGGVGNCYWNVDDWIKRRKGEAVYGWLIVMWRDLYVEALHHAVWRSTGGTLVDVTSKYPGDRHPYSTFVPDPAVLVDLTRPPFIPSRYYALRDVPEVRAVFDVATKQLTHKRNLVHGMLDAGGVWIPQKGIRIHPAHQARFAAGMAEADRYRREVSNAWEKCMRL